MCALRCASYPVKPARTLSAQPASTATNLPAPSSVFSITVRSVTPSPASSVRWVSSTLTMVSALTAKLRIA